MLRWPAQTPKHQRRTSPYRKRERGIPHFSRTVPCKGCNAGRQLRVVNYAYFPPKDWVVCRACSPVHVHVVEHHHAVVEHVVHVVRVALRVAHLAVNHLRGHVSRDPAVPSGRTVAQRIKGTLKYKVSAWGGLCVGHMCGAHAGRCNRRPDPLSPLLVIPCGMPHGQLGLACALPYTGDRPSTN